MQGGPSTEAPMLPRAVLSLLGMGLQGLYADLLEQPLPAGMKDALSHIREVPHLLPSLRAWQHASMPILSAGGHQAVTAL